MPLPPCLPSLSPFTISILGCSGLPLPPSLPSLSPFLISLLDCSWLPLPPCLLASFSSWFLFWAALGCRCHLISQLVPLHDFAAWGTNGKWTYEHKKTLFFFGNAIWGLCRCNFFGIVFCCTATICFWAAFAYLSAVWEKKSNSSICLWVKKKTLYKPQVLAYVFFYQ